MINLEFIMQPGEPSIMEYDVHPYSQTTAIPIPDGATGVVIWMGTVPYPRNTRTGDASLLSKIGSPV